MSHNLNRALIVALCTLTIGAAAPAHAQVMGSSQLPPLPALPPLPHFALPVGSSMPQVPGVPMPVAGNGHIDTVLGQINAERIAVGLHPVTYDFRIADRAYGHTRVLLDNDSLNHSGAELEIIARVPNIPEAVSMWLGSPAHRDVMLYPDVSKVGMGLEFDPTDGRWVIVAQFT